MEKYCKSCGRVFDDINFKLCPYCGLELATRYGRQPIPRKLRHEVFKRDGYRCRECGASKDETSLEIDHIVPVTRGGTNDIDNLQTLCRECNRMKHTDEWVGGETDLETVKQELDSLKNQIKKAKMGLKQSTTEDDKIEYEYQIMTLEKRLPDIENRYEKLYNENKHFEAKKEKEERKKKLYKKLYVKIDEEAYKKWSKDNIVRYDTKEQFINYACNLSESDVDDYIYNINLYKELINNSKKLSVYERLYNELNDESVERLKENISQNFSKGLLILYCLNNFDMDKIRIISDFDGKRYNWCNSCQKQIFKVYETCPYCRSNNIANNVEDIIDFDGKRYNWCNSCQKQILKVYGACPYCGSKNIDKY